MSHSFRIPEPRWSIHAWFICNRFRDEVNNVSNKGITIDGINVDSNFRDVRSSLEKLVYKLANILSREFKTKPSSSLKLICLPLFFFVKSSNKLSTSPITLNANFILSHRFLIRSFRSIISLHSSSRLAIFRSVLWTMYDAVRSWLSFVFRTRVTLWRSSSPIRTARPSFFLPPSSFIRLIALPRISMMFILFDPSPPAEVLLSRISW